MIKKIIVILNTFVIEKNTSISVKLNSSCSYQTKNIPSLIRVMAWHQSYGVMEINQHHSDDNTTNHLTHLPLGKMTTISQMTFGKVFSLIKMFVFWFEFHWSVFLRAQLTIFSIGSDDGLAPIRRQALIWTNADPVHWRIYAALGEMI